MYLKMSSCPHWVRATGIFMRDRTIIEKITGAIERFRDKQGWVSTEDEDFVKVIYAGIFDENNIKDLKRFIAGSKQMFDTHEENGVQWVALKGQHKDFSGKPSFWQRVKSLFSPESEEAPKQPSVAPQREERESKAQSAPRAPKGQPRKREPQRAEAKQAQRPAVAERTERKPRKTEASAVAKSEKLSRQAIERGTLRIDLNAKESSELLKLCGEKNFTTGERRDGAYINIKRFVNEALITQLRLNTGVRASDKTMFDLSLRTPEGEPVYVVVKDKNARELSIVRFVTGAEAVAREAFPALPVFASPLQRNALRPAQLLLQPDAIVQKLNRRELIRRHAALFPESIKKQIPVLGEIELIPEDLTFRERVEKERVLRDQLIADKEAMVLMEKTLDKALAYSLGMLKDAPLGIRFGYNNKWQKTVLLVPFSFEEGAPVIGALAVPADGGFVQLFSLSEAQLMLRLLGRREESPMFEHSEA